jgi:hypothetical protein
VKWSAGSGFVTYGLKFLSSSSARAFAAMGAEMLSACAACEYAGVV